MKAYLKYLSVRLVAGILVIALVYLGNKIFSASHSQVDCENVEVLILGDSHFNGVGLPKALHLGQDSDTYFTMYNKLVSKAESCNLKTVVLSFSYINLSSNYFDDFLRTDTNQSYSLASRNMSYRNLLSLMGEGIAWSSVLKVFSRNKFSFGDDFLVRLFSQEKDAPRSGPSEYKYDNRDYIEKLRRTQKNKKRKLRTATPGYKNKIEKSIDRLFEVDGGEVSTWNQHYLNKIVEYCQTNSLKLYLVNTPLETRYNKLIPTKFKETLELIVARVTGNTQDVHYVDLTQYYKSSDYFIDEHHVTQYGAALISEEIRKRMVN